MKINVILMKTGIQTFTTAEQIRHNLSSGAYGGHDVTVYEIDGSVRVPYLWQETLAFHDVEASGVAEEQDFEGTKVVVLHDNVVLHNNAYAILSAEIPARGDRSPFHTATTHDNGPEVNAKIKTNNESMKELADMVTERNLPYLNVPMEWWNKQEQSFGAYYMAWNYGDTKDLWPGWDAMHDMEEQQDQWYSDNFVGIMWPTNQGAIVDLTNDDNKEMEWQSHVVANFPQGFNPRDKFDTALEYSEEMHKPFFSRDDGLHQHIAMVFYNDFGMVEEMPL